MEPSTPRILDRLDQLGLGATFFCLGQLVDRDPDLAVEIRHRGHQVETHGYRHVHHFTRGPGWVRSDLEAALEALGRSGFAPRWYRPPYGQITAGTAIAAGLRRLNTVLWSAWGREWTTSDPAAVVARVKRGLAPGSIVLLHDSDFLSRAGTARVVEEALGPLADELDRRGLKTVTLDELVGAAA